MFCSREVDSVKLAEIGSNEKVGGRECREDKQNTRTLAKSTEKKIIATLQA